MESLAVDSLEQTKRTKDDLPLDLDIWREVCDQLDVQDIARLSQSSKKASDLVSRMFHTRHYSLLTQ
jgi:hypothetical protein